MRVMLLEFKFEVRVEHTTSFTEGNKSEIC